MTYEDITKAFPNISPDELADICAEYLAEYVRVVTGEAVTIYVAPCSERFYPAVSVNAKELH